MVWCAEWCKAGQSSQTVLVCVYIDDLLQTLAQSNVECYTGLVFVGALAYADDVLLAPNATANWQALQFQIAMHKILHICEKYAINLSANFYLSKSKCTVCEFHPKLKPANVNHIIVFTSCGSDIEVVDSWPHLACVIRCDLSDSADIARSHNTLLTQVNSVLCTFSSLHAVVKIKLLKNVRT